MNKTIILFLLVVICVSWQLQAADNNSFSIPEVGHQFSFPRDYGSHDDFKMEWWYITGHLFNDEGKRFGFESTFFRTALKPSSEAPLEKQSDFGTQTIFFADMAFLDVKTKKFLLLI